MRYIPLGTLLNWAFWFGVFYLVGGMALVCALFGGACVWAVGVRTFNYGAHGSGKDLRVDGERVRTPKLAYFAVPRYYRTVEELPKTGTHRVIKSKLQEDGITQDTCDAEKEGVMAKLVETAIVA